MRKIVEHQLGIPGDYQFKALSAKNYLQSNWHSNKLTVLGELVKKYNPESVLDLGTGSGNFELTFAKNIKQIVGVDYNQEALNFLSKELKKRKINNIKLIKKDLLKIEGAKPIGKFDMIIMVDVIEHLDNKKLEGLVGSFAKMLTKKGKIVIVTPNYSGIWVIIERFLDIISQTPQLANMQHVTKFDTQSLAKLFRKFKFHQIQTTTFNTYSFLFPSKTFSSKLCKLEYRHRFPYGSLLMSVYEAK